MCIISFLTSFMIVFTYHCHVTLPSRMSNTLTQPWWGHKSAHLLQFHKGEIWGGNLNHIIVTLLWGKVHTIFGSKWNWWTGGTWFETKEVFFCLDGPYPCFAFSFCSRTTKQLCNNGKKSCELSFTWKTSIPTCYLQNVVTEESGTWRHEQTFICHCH